MRSDKPTETIFDSEGNEHKIVDYNNDYTGAKLGFWLFLFTELMLFGAMFLIFSYFFYKYSQEFALSSKELNLILGSVNTVILLLSTYFMGMSLSHLKTDEIGKCRRNLYITIFLAFLFLLIKYFEWMAEISHGSYPNSEILNSMEDGKILFIGLYFTMTGFHGLHIIVGILVMFWVLHLISVKKITQENRVFLENTTLYWDVVHLVWVFLFPLFYMIQFGV